MNKEKFSTYLKTLSFVGTICYYIALAIYLALYFPVFVFAYVFITPFDKSRRATHYITKLFCMIIIRLCPFWSIKIDGL